MIRVTSPGMTAHGTKIEIDGREVRDVRDATVHFGVDEANSLRLELIPRDGFEMEFDALVQMDFFPLPGCRIEREVVNGRQVVRCVPETSEPDLLRDVILEALGSRALRVRP